MHHVHRQRDITFRDGAWESSFLLRYFQQKSLSEKIDRETLAEAGPVCQFVRVSPKPQVAVRLLRTGSVIAQVELTWHSAGAAKIVRSLSLTRVKIFPVDLGKTARRFPLENFTAYGRVRELFSRTLFRLRTLYSYGTRDVPKESLVPDPISVRKDDVPDRYIAACESIQIALL